MLSITVHGAEDPFATVGRDGSIRMFDAGMFSRPQRLDEHRSLVYAAALTNGDRRLASGGWDGVKATHEGGRASEGNATLRWWDVASGEAIGFGRAPWAKVTHLAAAAGDRVVVATEPFHLVVLSSTTGRVVARHDADLPENVKSLDVLGDVLAIGTQGRRRTGLQKPFTTSVYDLETLSLVTRTRGGRDVRFLPNGDLVAGGGELTRFSADGWAPVWTVPLQSQSRGLAVRPDGERVAVAHADGTVSEFSARDGTRTARLDIGEGLSYCALYSPDQRLLFVGGQSGELHVLDAVHHEPITTLRDHGDYVFDLDVSDDGETLVSASGDRTLRLWDTVPSHARLAAAREHRALMTRWRPRVSAWLDDDGLTVDDVPARIAALPDLSAREREVALQALLAESLARDPDPMGERFLEPDGAGR